MRNLNKLIIFIILLFALGVNTEARQRTQKSVQSERRAAAQKIERTRRELTENEKQTQRELRGLQALEGEIRVHETEVSRLSAQAADLQRRSKALGDSIEANEARLKVLRESYARAVRSMRRQRQLAGDASFIFSSSSFSQARSRMRYLKELSSWQTGKTVEIDEATQQLALRRARLDTLGRELRLSLDSLGRVRQALGERKHQADAVVGSLRRQGRNLKRVISEQQRLVKKLDDELNRIIEAEARAAAEARRKAEAEARRSAQNEKETAAKPVQNQSEKPKDRPAPRQPEQVDRLTAPFEQCKGRLPWPLDRQATVASTFGRHTHETLERVTVQNNGVDFETVPGASARAVYDGTVSMIIVMEGYQNVVLVRHGQYLTVYAGLHELRVRKGDKVKGGQLLGTLFSDPADDNRTRLHFEVRREKDKLDPMQWLRR